MYEGSCHLKLFSDTGPDRIGGKLFYQPTDTFILNGPLAA